MATVKLIKRPPPPTHQANIIKSTAKGEIRELVEEVARKHREYVAPWELSGDKPAFEVEDLSERGKTVLAVSMDADAAEQASLSVWQLLDRGTTVRYMQVSEDWESKTWPGQPFSGPGAGETTGLDLGDPQEGIEERKIGEMIAEQFDPDTEIRDAYDAGFERNFR